MKSRFILLRYLIPLLAIALANWATIPASAQTTYTWTDVADGTGGWAEATNWDANGVPVAATNNTIKFYAGTSGAANTVTANITASQNLGNSFDVGALTFNGVATATRTFTISGNSLDFANGGTITNNVGANVRYTVSSAISITNQVVLAGASNSSQNLELSGRITGSGSLLKQDAGRITLSNVSSTNPNNFTGGVTISGGRLLAGGNGVLGTGVLTMNGGILTYSGTSSGDVRTFSNSSVVFSANSQMIDSSQIQGGATINFTTATLDLGGGAFVFTIDNTTASGGTFANSGLSVTFNNFVSNGSLTKSGRGVLVLNSAASTYTGDTIIRQGTIRVGANAPSGSNGALGNATSAIQLGDASSNVSANVTLENNGAFNIARNITVSGQNSSGTSIIRGSNAAGTTSTFSGNVTLNRGVTLGTTTAGATTNFTGVIDDGGGSFAVTTIGSGVTVLASATGNTYDGGTTIVTGTTLKVSNTTGSGSATGTGTVTIDNGGTLTGSGSISGTLALSGTISPGDSPGTMSTGSESWLAGGNYNWQMLNAAGTPGTGYDTLSATGTLDLSALDSGNPFNINLWTLSAITPDTNGNAANFNNAISQSWTLISTTGGITGFESTDFLINTGAANGTGGFSNALGGGSFSLSSDGNNLLLNFTAVPEPSPLAASLLSLLGVVACRRRRAGQAKANLRWQ